MLRLADTRNVYICVVGDVVLNHLIFQGSDSLETVIANRRERDILGASTVGIKLIESTELSEIDI